jgi:Cys-tRNA(Pro)/Cys-tRNA(Cys) deacylase
MLEAKKVDFKAFEVPAEKLNALEVARILGVSPGQVFKTIVIVRPKPGKPVLAVVSADCEVNLKSLAAFLGEKKVSVPTQNDAEQMTGLLSGGISPLALINKGFQVVLDRSMMQFERIYLSGGQRGLQISLPPQALVELTRARSADISEPLK